MPLPSPTTDNRTYQALVDELIARIPAHTPEWTNFNQADPGITLIQLFAHITESLLYRTNQIPDRNRAKFLNLLGLKLNPAREAQGMAAFANERGPVDPLVIAAGAELFAGAIPFRTTAALDVLPLEARFYLRRPIANPSRDMLDHYALLYASYNKPAPQALTLYETVESVSGENIRLADTVDHCLWIALLGRKEDRALDDLGDPPWTGLRKKLDGRTLSLGIIPDLAADQLVARPRAGSRAAESLLHFELPNAAGPIAFGADGQPDPRYAQLAPRGNFDPLVQPGVVELTLPGAAGIDTWRDLDPLEAGVGDLPPMVDAPDIGNRIVTWLRLRAGSSTDVKLRWVGINAAGIRQRLLIPAERLPPGDGTPDQTRRLHRAPLLAGSVQLTSVDGDVLRQWQEIDDLRAAGPELAMLHAPDMGDPVDVFECDAEAGILRFGDGLTGRRPRDKEVLYASYAYSEGIEGNVGARALKGGPLLPAGVTATNMVPTWGGADPEPIASGEKQIARFITHRDRLVSVEDFRVIAWRTPGVAIGRIEVLPAAHPDVAPVEIGSAPGAVTLMAIPADDPAHPEAPRADRPFLTALCAYLEPRRLVTTELVLRGPDYVGVWISVGIEVAGNRGVAETVEAVTARLKGFLGALPAGGSALPPLPLLYGPDVDPALRGWPLGRAVNARTLLAEAARTPGVVSVEDVLLARGARAATESVPLVGLELPEILGISVVAGTPLSLDLVRGTGAPAGDGTAPSETVRRLPAPVLAETC
jgi:hypothetical protein